MWKYPGNTQTCQTSPASRDHAPPSPAPRWSRNKTWQLFYILGVCYTTLFLLVSAVLSTAPLGLVNWEGRFARVVGWVSFVAIESYGSLAVALFWAFTNSTVDLEGAKASYGLIIAGAQIGAIIGGCCCVAEGFCVDGRFRWIRCTHPVTSR